MTINQSLVEEAADKKRSGLCNCAQAIACTYASAVGADESDMAAVAAAFGTGMGTLKATCGALIGAGIIYGRAVADRNKARVGMKRIFSGFEASVGHTVCGAIKGVGTGKVLAPCDECVAEAARQLQRELSLI